MTPPVAAAAEGTTAVHRGHTPGVAPRTQASMSSSYYYSDAGTADEAALDFILEPRPAAGYTNIIRRLANYTGPVLPAPDTPMSRHASPGRGREAMSPSRSWTKTSVLSAADSLRGPKPSTSPLIVGFAPGVEEIDEASLEKVWYCSTMLCSPVLYCGVPRRMFVAVP